MNGLVRAIYQALRLYNDINAVRRGPRAVARRQARKAGYKLVNRAVRRLR